MPKFRKLPAVVDAEQWFPGIWIDGVRERANGAYALVETLEGLLLVNEGDWIITGVAGEKYPCKPSIFEATYELVEDG